MKGLPFPSVKVKPHCSILAGFLNSVGLLWDAKDQHCHRNLFKLCCLPVTPR